MRINKTQKEYNKKSRELDKIPYKRLFGIVLSMGFVGFITTVGLNDWTLTILATLFFVFKALLIVSFISTYFSSSDKKETLPPFFVFEFFENRKEKVLHYRYRSEYNGLELYKITTDKKRYKVEIDDNKVVSLK